jgi:phospholipid/cholesterol/gamma-HCH transport system ATP-binding protein
MTHLSREQLNRLRTRVGMVFQSSALISSLSVFENLALALRELTRKGKREITAIIEEKLHFVGLEEAQKLDAISAQRRHEKAHRYRSSSRSESGVAPFDEPTAGLDPTSAYYITELIAHLNREAAVTILVVTHDLQSVFRVATRIAVLDQGRIVEEGSPEAIKESLDPAVRRFVGPSPPDGFSKRPSTFAPIGVGHDPGPFARLVHR